MKRAWLPIAVWIARVALAALFLYAGVIKLLDPSEFALEIARYELFPEFAAHVAAALPMTELVLGLGMLALPFTWRRAAALGACALLVVFTIAAASAVARGLDIECGCFGTASSPITWLTLLRDVVLVAASVLLVCDPPVDTLTST
jgi:uncharacterized membrane protein YphA (DoxX/SURF4 family)